jgi:hypothetical protein
MNELDFQKRAVSGDKFIASEPNGLISCTQQPPCTEPKSECEKSDKGGGNRSNSVPILVKDVALAASIERDRISERERSWWRIVGAFLLWGRYSLVAHFSNSGLVLIAQQVNATVAARLSSHASIPRIFNSR